MTTAPSETGQPVGSGSRRVPTWRQLHPGEDPRIEAQQFQRFREAPAWEKAAQLHRLNTAARRLALAGLRSRYPEATMQELRRRLADMLLGSELAERVYGPIASENRQE